MKAEDKNQLEQDAINYREDLLLEVQNEFELSGKTSEEAFTDLVTDALSEATVVDDYSPSFFDETVGKKRHYHINGYSFSEVDRCLNLFVTKYDGSENPKRLGVPDIRSDIEAALNFVADRKTIRKKASEAAGYVDCIEVIDSHMDDTETSIRKIRLNLLTDCIAKDNLRKIKLPAVESIPVDLIVYDMLFIYKLSTAGSDIGIVKIDFNEYSPYVVRCVPAGESGAPNKFRYSSYIGVIPGVVLADLYDEYGARLLEGNVRSFLSVGSKKGVNWAIRETILRTPEQFFAFNNGVSVTALNARFDDKGNLIYAEDFQIINGGQTTASLSNARFCNRKEADLSKVSVLMKLTVVKDGMDDDSKQDLLSTIAKASNRQNKVSEADFFSTHPFHVKIEKISEATSAPPVSGSSLYTHWFYERARGQYNQRQMKMTRAQREKFKQEYPSKQKITKTDLAKFRYSWEEKPYIVSRGAQTNFGAFAKEISDNWSKGESEQAKYTNPQYFKDTIALAIMFKSVGDIVSNQEWYQNSFRANIVTYSISLFHKLLSSQFPDSELNLNLIWQAQELPPIMKKIFKRLTTQVYHYMVDNFSGNVTQRCKKQEFWTSMSEDLDLRLSCSEIKPLLISTEERKRINARAKDVGKALGEADIQEMVWKKGIPYWNRVKRFATETTRVGLLPKEESAIFMIQQGRLPPPFLCKMLVKLEKRCEGFGFKG